MVENEKCETGLCPFNGMTGIQLGEYIQTVRETRKDVKEILEHAKLTNGRVTSLEIRMQDKVDDSEFDEARKLLYKIVGFGIAGNVLLIPVLLILFKHFFPGS